VEPTGPASLAWPGDLDFDPDALIWGGRRRPDGARPAHLLRFIAPRRLRPDSQPKRTCGDPRFGRFCHAGYRQAAKRCRGRTRMTHDAGPETSQTDRARRSRQQEADLIEWARYNRRLLAMHDLVGTGTTGTMLERELELR